ncbi:MAG: GNAT family N-acetyltransferase, partial [Gammaproteobacteria bacterium]|nr:GNAT family N-acetyltransferase [Gammaproteobacteria bacterium]
MSAALISKDNWTLRKASSADIDDMMRWFSDAEAINIWGGPTFRYPFTRETFFEDIGWDRLASFALYDAADTFAAFGQVYERIGRINFARLVVNPAMRGRGVGKRLVELLMSVSASMYDCDEYSLFVYRGNIAAYACYRSMGF